MRLFVLFLLLFFQAFSAPIEKFAQSILKIEDAKITKNSQNDLVEGGRLADIFFIQSPSIKNTLIVKRYSKEIGQTWEWKKEKEAYDYLKKKNFKHLKTAQLIKAEEDDEYLYLVLSKAEGISLNQLLKKRQTLPFWQKHAYDKKIVKALENCAKSFHELHFQTGKNQTKSIAENSAAPEMLLSRVYPYIKNKKLVEKNFHQLRKKVLDKPLKFGTTHGDLHLGNIFFDPDSETVTLIDLSTLSFQSYRAGKTPIAEEIANFLVHFAAIGNSYDYTDAEIRYYLNAFKKAYPNYELMKEEISYFKLLTLLRLIELCQDGSKNQVIDYQMRKIFTFSKNAISSKNS